MRRCWRLLRGSRRGIRPWGIAHVRASVGMRRAWGRRRRGAGRAPLAPVWLPARRPRGIVTLLAASLASVVTLLPGVGTTAVAAALLAGLDLPAAAA